MLHPAVAEELLDYEVAVAREAHGRRVTTLTRVGTNVICEIPDTNVGAVTVRFEGVRYDAEPLGVAVVGPEGTVAPIGLWPAGLPHSVHPTLNRPFSCIRGCDEYHHYPGHTNDPWDHHRASIRLVNLLDHILRKVGR